MATPAEKLAKKVKRNPGEESEKVYPLQSTMRNRREQLGLTLHDVAIAVGLSTSTISRLECGRDGWITAAMKLCRFYQCGIEELWREASR